MNAQPKRRLILIGGGHTHVQVLRRLAMQPDPSVHVTVVSKRPFAVYSGMIPGHVAGQYTASEVSIDLVPLARRAHAAIVLSEATRVDGAARTVHLADGRPPVPWDRCSINIGSTVSGLDTPGVRARVVSTRPIHDLNPRIATRLQSCGNRNIRLVIVGGGAAGVELAFAMETRLRLEKRNAEVVLIAKDGPAVGGGAGGPERVRRCLSDRGIILRTGARVTEVRDDAVMLSDGGCLPADLVMWATGAAAHPLGARSGLPVDAGGFIQTTPQLEVVGVPNLFAAGDCAVLADGPTVPRSGVYAVRAGPVLIHNLLVARAPSDRIPFRPQATFLALLNACDGRAVATRGR
jgi:selenide,water dikinase